MKTSEHARALNAGLSPKEAARWLAYLELCRTKGKQPISLTDAVAQVRAARPAAA